MVFFAEDAFYEQLVSISKSIKDTLELVIHSEIMHKTVISGNEITRPQCNVCRDACMPSLKDNVKHML